MQEAVDMQQCSMTHEGIVRTAIDAAAPVGMKGNSQVGSDIISTVRNTAATVQTESSRNNSAQRSGSVSNCHTSLLTNGSPLQVTGQ